MAQNKPSSASNKLEEEKKEEETVNTLLQESTVNTLSTEEMVSTTRPKTKETDLQDISFWQEKNRVPDYKHNMIMVSRNWKKGKKVTESEYLSNLSTLGSIN